MRIITQLSIPVMSKSCCCSLPPAAGGQPVTHSHLSLSLHHFFQCLLMGLSPIVRLQHVSSRIFRPFIWDRVLLYSLGWPDTHYVPQVGLRLAVFLPPQSIKCWDDRNVLLCPGTALKAWIASHFLLAITQCNPYFNQEKTLDSLLRSGRAWSGLCQAL